MPVSADGAAGMDAARDDLAAFADVHLADISPLPLFIPDTVRSGIVLKSIRISNLLFLLSPGGALKKQAPFSPFPNTCRPLRILCDPAASSCAGLHAFAGHEKREGSNVCRRVFASLGSMRPANLRGALFTPPQAVSSPLRHAAPRESVPFSGLPCAAPRSKQQQRFRP